MANKKRLQKAAIMYRKRNRQEHSIVCTLMTMMSMYIKKLGTPEVTVGIDKYGGYYKHAN